MPDSDDNAPATIFALSSGLPPAAIGVVRISGPEAGGALAALAGRLPEARRATLAWLRDPVDGERLDRALALWFPGPKTATGEDVAELHIHGGRSVAAAVSRALGRLPGLRAAQPGEFTRRAFANGVIDLAEAEGLADLLAAETESQRRHALALAGGALSRQVSAWQEDIVAAAAAVEAILDFSDEGDVALDDSAVRTTPCRIAAEIGALLARPSVDRLRDGIRLVIAGPPNAGKSTLLNALVGREAAITAPMAGTTRDLVEAPVAIGGVPFVVTDTAGLRDGEDMVERIGIDRARAAMAAADIILWLGEPEACADLDRAVVIHPRSDEPGRGLLPPGAALAVSAISGAGMDSLVGLLLARASLLLPGDNELALNQRQRDALARCHDALVSDRTEDIILLAEQLRAARAALDRVTGRAGVEDVLDALFGRFCIGK